MSDIRGVVLGAVEHPDTGAYLVQRLPGDRDGPHFHRFVGGGIHPGEPSDAALEREFQEELGVTVETGPAVCTVENLFTYEGVSHHEFAVVRAARFSDASLYDRERFSGVDTGGVEYEAYWRTLADLRDADAPFFPEGVADLLAARDADDTGPGEGAGHILSLDPTTDER